MHVSTGHCLHSHAILSVANQQEVTCFKGGGAHDANDYWKVADLGGAVGHGGHANQSNGDPAKVINDMAIGFGKALGGLFGSKPKPQPAPVVQPVPAPVYAPPQQQQPGYPPQAGAPGYPPQQQQPGYPPQASAPGYPPQQPGYPPQAGVPGYPPQQQQQPGYPPQQPGYPPQASAPGYPPQQPGGAPPPMYTPQPVPVQQPVQVQPFSLPPPGTSIHLTSVVTGKNMRLKKTGELDAMVRFNTPTPAPRSTKRVRVIFFDFAGLSTRTEGPHGGASYVQKSKRNRTDRHLCIIEW